MSEPLSSGPAVRLAGVHKSFPVKGGYSVVPRYTQPEGKAVLLLKSNDVDSPA